MSSLGGIATTDVEGVKTYVKNIIYELTHDPL